MWVRCLRAALLLWIPAVLHAQRRSQPCSAPTLNKGYFLPLQPSYSHEAQITYSCDKGYKPVVEDWWATITCQNGHWSHDPQCIEEAACIPPMIPNADLPENPNGWYEDGTNITITCKKGYIHKNQNNQTALCTRGTWSVPVCHKNPISCLEPPSVPNAVIIQRHQEVFAVRSQVVYQCKDGYVTEQRERTKSIACFNGTWTQGPTCRRSTSSSSSDRDENRAVVPINECANPPEIENGVREEETNALKYTCKNHYKLVGPATVECYSDGSWSEVPTCRENFCLVQTEDYPRLKDVGNTYMNNGDSLELQCTDVWKFPNYVVVQCIDGKPLMSRCCNRAQINLGIC